MHLFDQKKIYILMYYCIKWNSDVIEMTVVKLHLKLFCNE